MIERLETAFHDFTIEDNFKLFEAKDSHLLRDLLYCVNFINIPGDYHHWVDVEQLAPDHVEWLKTNLEGWCLIELCVENHFRFWFTLEEDKIDFVRTYDHGEE